VVLVDVQITLAVELHGEAAVLGQLLEHVIEEADAGRHGDRRGRIQVDHDVDAGFPGLALRGRAACGQLADDGGPGFLFGALAPDAHTTDTQVSCELQVRIPIADHHARSAIDTLHVLIDEPGGGLAARAAIGFEVRAHEDGVELDALRAECVEDEVMRDIEGLLRKALRAEAVLVGDHHQPEATAFELIHGGEHAGHEADLVGGIDLLVVRLLDERAIAVDEQDLRAAHRSAPSRRSF
jgi:hypothetical protein